MTGLADDVPRWPTSGAGPQYAWLELDAPIGTRTVPAGTQGLALHARNPHHSRLGGHRTYVYKLSVPLGVAVDGTSPTGLAGLTGIVGRRPGQHLLLPLSAVTG